MQIKLRVLSLLFFTVVVFFNAHPVKACSCGGTPTVIDSLEKSENVFIGEVSAVDKSSGEYSYKGVKGAKVTVKKVYKGNLKEGEIVFFDQGNGSDCLWLFEERFAGAKFLIYDSDSPFPRQGEFMRRGVNGCGRSQSVSADSTDLTYLDNLEKVRGRTRIYGKVWFYNDRESAANRKISIVGKDKTYEAISDRNGNYEIYDLPAGEYLIQPDIPKGWRIEENLLRLIMIARTDNKLPEAESPRRFPLTLSAQKDASQDFLYVADNTLRGRVVDVTGKPLKGICVAAVKTEEIAFKYAYGNCTNDAGEFEIRSLDRDEYVLVINGDGKISPSQPIRTLYFPGVKTRSDAAVVRIKEGENIALKDFKVQELAEVITLRGKAVFSDGTPVRRQPIEFIFDQKDDSVKGDNYGYFSDYMNDDGIFEIKIFKGQSGKLRVQMFFSKKVLEICPAIKQATLEDRSAETVIASTQLTGIKADRDLTDIKLVFPFPNCPRQY